MAHLWVTGEAITAPLLNDMERRVDSANLQAGTFSEGPWAIQIVDSHLNLTAPRGPEGRPGEKGDPGPPGYLTAGTITILPDGSDPHMEITDDHVLNLKLPIGYLKAGIVTMLPYDSDPVMEITDDHKLNLKIPEGKQGERGQQGEKGDTGSRGSRWFWKYVDLSEGEESPEGSIDGDYEFDMNGEVFEVQDGKLVSTGIVLKGAGSVIDPSIVNRVDELETELSSLSQSYETLKSSYDNVYSILYDSLISNPFELTFDNLTGVTVSAGCWNQEEERLEC